MIKIINKKQYFGFKWKNKKSGVEYFQKFDSFNELEKRNILNLSKESSLKRRRFPKPSKTNCTRNLRVYRPPSYPMPDDENHVAHNENHYMMNENDGLYLLSFAATNYCSSFKG